MRKQRRIVSVLELAIGVNSSETGSLEDSNR